MGLFLLIFSPRDNRSLPSSYEIQPSLSGKDTRGVFEAKALVNNKVVFTLKVFMDISVRELTVHGRASADDYKEFRI